MLDWARITADLEHALTLDIESAQVFLEKSIDDEKTRELAQDLFERARPKRAFMETSAPGGSEPAKTEPLATETRIDQWEIESLIGKGGMGEVYRAHRADGLYEQTVALKMIYGASEARIARFTQERRRLARLEHPNIARIVDGGTTPDGRAYMAMEHVDGQEIDSYVKTNGLGLRPILALFRALCAAVSYAHSQLILHRDIKPENVLVDSQNQIRLIDFGIATGLEDDGIQAMALTLSSAAPEQLEGRVESVQTDVFALGVLLHRLCTDEFPSRLSDGGMAPKSELVGSVDLNAILSRCLAASIADRYPSVDALMEDLTALVGNRPVSARNGGWFYQVQKGIARYPLAASLSAVTALALVMGTIVSVNFAGKAGAEADRAQMELQRAEWALAEAELNAKVAQAYSDSMQKLFGNEADVERMGSVLETHWAESWSNPELTDQEKAIISFAVGEHFSSRGDHTKAIKVLEPWIQSERGDTRLLSAGKSLISLPYLVNGEPQKATQQVTEAAALYEGTFLENSPEHVTTAVKAAFYSHKPEEFEKAKRLALSSINSGVTDVQKVRLWNQLLQLNLRTRDWPEALAASRNAASLVEQSTEYPIVNSFRQRLNALEMEFYIGDRHPRIVKQASSLIERMEAETGESFDLGLAYLLKAVAEREYGDIEAAKSSIDRALELAKSYSEEGSHIDLKFTAFNVLIRTDLGDLEAAQTEIELAEEITKGRPDRWRDIMAAYMILKEDGPEGANTFLRGKETNLYRARAYIRLNYILDQMTEAGMDWSGLEPEAT